MSDERTRGLSYVGRETHLALPYRLRKRTKPVREVVQIFLHIPKCAGTTIDHILAACANYYRRGFSRYLVVGHDPPIFLEPGWTGAWDGLVDRSASEEAKVRFVSGHFPFGVHEILGRRCRYVTLLREPVAREISSFNFHYQRGYLDGETSIDELIDAKRILDNPQTRMLAGREAMSGACTEETYRLAVYNMDTYFDLVGVAERADEFIRALLALNGWPAVIYHRAQVSGIRLIDNPSDEVASQLQRFHNYDAQLWRRADKAWRAWRDRYVKADRPLRASDDAIRIHSDFQQTGRISKIKMADLQGR